MGWQYFYFAVPNSEGMGGWGGGGTLRFTSTLGREGVCVCGGGGGKFDIGCTPLSVRLQSANRHSQTDRGALLLRAL